MLGSTWRERLAELGGGAEPGRAEGGKGRPSFGQFRIGGEPGHLALPERDPVFRKLFEILGASHPSGL
jgi:hypothetical protein